MKHEIIVFKWSDAAMYGNDQKSREEWSKAALITGVVAGHILSETKEYITIAMDLFPTGTNVTEDNYRTVSVYPKDGIIKVIKRFAI